VSSSSSLEYQQLEPSKVYSILTNDYVAKEGDSLLSSSLYAKEPKPFSETPRDLLEHFVRHNVPITEELKTSICKNHWIFNENDDNAYDTSFDKSYSVIMLSQVLDELKKSKGKSNLDNEIPVGKIQNRNSSRGEEIIHEYRKPEDEINTDRKIKMKKGYDKRSYSLKDKNYFDRENHSEFAIRKYGTGNNNAQFSIRRSETEQIIPKYYSSPSASPSTSPIILQRGYKSFDDKYSLYNKYHNNDTNILPENLYKTEKNNDFRNLNIKNEWSEVNTNKNNENHQENFHIESKGLNIGDSLINDNIFTGFNYETDTKNNELNNNYILNDPSNKENSFNKKSNISSLKKNNTEYSINSDDTYDRLFLSNDLSIFTSDDSFNTIKGIDKSKKSKKSFKQKVMRRFSRTGSKKVLKKPRYFEWENLPLEIVFNIFKNFSIQEIARLREVSRYFNYILTNPIFYMNINLTNESDTADNKLLFYQWKYSNGYLLALNLSQCNLINENVFKDAIDYKIQERKINNTSTNERANLCFNNTNAKFEKEESLVQNLRCLDLSYCSGIYSSKIMCNFFRGFSIPPNGIIIKKNGCINLEELNLSDLYQILNDDLLMSIADGCPNLKKLYISKGYDITNYAVKMILRKCKHLESLKLVNCPKINYEAFDTRRIEEISIMSDDVSYDLNLKYLNVNNCRMMEDNFIKMVSNNCPYLEELHISGCQNISDEGMKYLVSGRAWTDKRVKALDISGCYCIGDNGIKTLTPSVLEKLDISDCSFITDTGLNYIFNGMLLLEEIGYENQEIGEKEFIIQIKINTKNIIKFFILLILIVYNLRKIFIEANQYFPV